MLGVLPPVCPRGGAQNLVCSGRGACNNGRLGDGTCSCYQTIGFWAGAICDTCVAGAYGPTCREVCPGGVGNPCTGHGVCDSGLNGTGTCTCADGWRPGRSCWSFRWSGFLLLPFTPVPF